MSNKRKSSDSVDTTNKRSKVSASAGASGVENSRNSKLERAYQNAIELLGEDEPNFEKYIEEEVEENEVLNALNYFKSIFPKEIFEELPEIIHLHQIYSLIKNKTKVDREIHTLRVQNRILSFKFDTNKESETLICFTDDFNEYVRSHIQPNSSHKHIIDLFLNKILTSETSQLSISKSSLLHEYQIGDSDISKLVQSGFLAIKDSSSFWFSIPGVGKFRRIVLETRKSLLDMLQRQKYKEINLRLFFDNLVVQKNKKFKAINKIGAVYIVCDLIGNELVRKINSPMGVVIKLN